MVGWQHDWRSILLIVLLAHGALQPRALAQDNAAQQIRLLVRSDDMGVATAVNRACLASCTRGIARSIEVIVPGPWFLQAAEMLRKHPEIDVGVHLDLTSEWSRVKWGPVSQDTPSLVDANGHFFPMTRQRKDFPPNTGFLESRYKLQEVERELRAQIELAKKHIPSVTHLSAHMGTAVSTAALKSLVARLAEEYQLPIELPGVPRVRIENAMHLSADQKEAALVQLLTRLKPGTWMLVEHPGLDTPEMRGISHKGYENVAQDRAGVTHALTSPKVLDVIERREIKLVSYADVLGPKKKKKEE